eukprot:1343246-Prymnesium_polylepis.1
MQAVGRPRRRRQWSWAWRLRRRRAPHRCESDCEASRPLPPAVVRIWGARRGARAWHGAAAWGRPWGVLGWSGMWLGRAGRRKGRVE